MKVAIYCRLSAEDRDKLSADDDSASIQNQKDMLSGIRGWQRWTYDPKLPFWEDSLGRGDLDSGGS